MTVTAPAPVTDRLPLSVKVPPPSSSVSLAATLAVPAKPAPDPPVSRSLPVVTLTVPPFQLVAPATVSSPARLTTPVPLRDRLPRVLNAPLRAVSVFAATESVWAPSGAPTSSRA